MKFSSSLNKILQKLWDILKIVLNSLKDGVKVFKKLSEILLKVKWNSLKNCEKFTWKLCEILIKIK